MFTSEDCVYCPPVESIVKEVVGSGMQDLVHVLTIDVDDDPEAEKQYNINALPTLVIDDETVLEGGMDDDSVREILWSTLLNKAVTSEEAVEVTKSSLLALTINAMGSLNGTRQLRTAVGDFTHIGIFQLNLLSLYSLDPLIPHLLYKAGQQLGLYGMMHHVLTLLNPKLGQTPRRDLKFKHLAYSLELYFSDRETLPTMLAESAQVVGITNQMIKLRVNDMASASLRVNVGEPMCGFFAGQLAGVTQAIMGTPSNCVETMCMANGSEYCLFVIRTGMDLKERSLPPLEDKIERATRRQNFYEVIHETTELINDSLLMRKIQRPEIGDFMHISVFQPIIISLKLLDRFSSIILYSGGRELGVFGPGKPLLYRLVQQAGIDVPMQLEEGVHLLHQYMTHPTTMLYRDQGLIRLAMKDYNTFVLEIEENASVAGLNTSNIGATFCDFLAGFFAGRLHILIGLDPIVQETQCQGMGAPFCTFEISVSEEDYFD
jgi:predicted hydrocarbon binding protein